MKVYVPNLILEGISSLEELFDSLAFRCFRAAERQAQEWLATDSSPLPGDDEVAQVSDLGVWAFVRAGYYDQADKASSGAGRKGHRNGLKARRHRDQKDCFWSA